MKLTRRQEEFILNLHELSDEVDGPIHYSLLAERLGVSPFTAYDMLCLLEEKGLAKSEYQLASDKSGPGRAERVFTPTVEAMSRQEHVVRAAVIGTHGGGDLAKIVLDRIRRGEFPDRDLLEQTLARIPPEIEADDLRFCMEVMTIIALRLRENAAEQDVIDFWSQVGENSNANSSHLSALAGFSYRIAAQECPSDPEWVNKMLENIKHVIEIISGMHPNKIVQLSDYVGVLYPPANNTRTDSE